MRREAEEMGRRRQWTVDRDGILLDVDTFQKVYTFENEGMIKLFFDMEGVKRNMGKPAIWRINIRQRFGSTLFRGYLTNKFGKKEDIESSIKEPKL